MAKTGAENIADFEHLLHFGVLRCRMNRILEYEQFRRASLDGLSPGYNTTVLFCITWLIYQQDADSVGLNADFPSMVGPGAGTPNLAASEQSFPT